MPPRTRHHTGKLFGNYFASERINGSASFRPQSLRLPRVAAQYYWTRCVRCSTVLHSSQRKGVTGANCFRCISRGPLLSLSGAELPHLLLHHADELALLVRRHVR
jgi:hypothetical protein